MCEQDRVAGEEIMAARLRSALVIGITREEPTWASQSTCSQIGPSQLNTRIESTLVPYVDCVNSRVHVYHNEEILVCGPVAIRDTQGKKTPIPNPQRNRCCCYTG